jgi:hypothetical protein
MKQNLNGPSHNPCDCSTETKPQPSCCSSHQLRSVCKLAEEHCANLDRNGCCKGVDFAPKTGRHFRWRKAGCECLLTLRQRCPYFETAVLPMEKRRERDWPTIAEYAAFQAGAKIYHRVFQLTVPNDTPDALNEAAFEQEMRRRGSLARRSVRRAQGAKKG